MVDLKKIARPDMARQILIGGRSLLTIFFLTFHMWQILQLIMTGE
jgi:hypothetical protein